MSHINWTLRDAPRIAWFLAEQAFYRWLDRRRGIPRELALLDHVRLSTPANDPLGVLQCMDRFSQRQRFLMSLGPEKGAMLRQLLQQHQPRNVLEIGTYCGYSAVLMGAEVRIWNGEVTTLEISRRNTRVARGIIDHAGLSRHVTSLNATLADAIGNFDKPFDFVLLDHWKDEYLADLQRLESAKLLAAGAVVMADNIGFFRVPDYLDYVRHSPQYRSRFIASSVEYHPRLPDGVEVSIFLGGGVGA